jgi:hypothetical protein
MVAVIFCRLALEVILLIPFSLTAIRFFIALKDDKQAKKWLRLSLINCQVSVSLLLIEFLLTKLAENPIFWPWLSTLFSIGNWIEANLVLFMMQDTKKAILKSGPVSQTMEPK